MHHAPGAPQQGSDAISADSDAVSAAVSAIVSAAVSVAISAAVSTDSGAISAAIFTFTRSSNRIGQRKRKIKLRWSHRRSAGLGFNSLDSNEDIWVGTIVPQHPLRSTSNYLRTVLRSRRLKFQFEWL